jgi:hypothetical protein
MVRMAITADAFEAIVATLALGSVGYEPQSNERGEGLIWVEGPSGSTALRLCAGRATATAT